MANNIEITSEYFEKIARPYETPMVDPMIILAETIEEYEKEEKGTDK